MHTDVFRPVRRIRLWLTTFHERALLRSSENWIANYPGQATLEQPLESFRSLKRVLQIQNIYYIIDYLYRIGFNLNARVMGGLIPMAAYQCKLLGLESNLS